MRTRTQRLTDRDAATPFDVNRSPFPGARSRATAPKALVLKQPRDELDKYLDVPAFARGDLFYILNLVETLEAKP